MSIFLIKVLIVAFIFYDSQFISDSTTASASTVGQGQSNPSTQSCSGIAGIPSFSEDLKRRTDQLKTNCFESSQLYRTTYTRLWQRLGICEKIALAFNAPWDSNLINELQSRYFESCERYEIYLGVSKKICHFYSSEAKKSEETLKNTQTSLDDLEALRSLDAINLRLVCTYGILEKSAWSVTSRLEKYTKESKDNSSNSQSDAMFTDIKNSIAKEVSRLPVAMNNRLSDPKFRKNLGSQERQKIQKVLTDCLASQNELNAFDSIYQRKIYQELLKMKQEGEHLTEFFGGQKKKFEQMRAQTLRTLNRLGTAGTEEVSDVVKVRPGKLNGAQPEIGTCPIGGNISDLDKSLKESVFFASRSDRVGSGFRVKTIGPDGKPIYQNVTAGHVVLDDFYDPNNNGMEDLKASPAGDIRGDQQDTLSIESIETMDRKHDVVTYKSGYGPALPVKSGEANPKVGQEFVLAGHPVSTYGSNYVNMSCSFLGYGAGDKSGYYVLDCPTANTSVGGMSGGPMVDPNTGTVWGVATDQGSAFDDQGTWLYRDNRIFVSPIQTGNNGQILTGPQNYDSGNCYYVDHTIPQPCYVSPMGVSIQ